MRLIIYYFTIIFMQPSLSDHSQGLYIFPTAETVSADGSSATGLCSNVTLNGTESVCSTPTTSVLFDGNIPTLTGLDGDMWASQLLTLQTTAPSTEITFDFTDTPGDVGVEIVKVVMFNCPERGISVSTINLHELDSGERLDVGSLNISITSCDSLLRVCLNATLTLPMLSIEFELAGSADQVYLAEVIFDGSDSCLTNVMILDGTATAQIATASDSTLPGQLQTTADTGIQTTPSVTPTFPTQCGMCPPCPTLCKPCPSCSTSTVRASAISVIVTVVLAIIIFALVQIIICRFAPKFRPRQADKVTHETGERATYLEEEGGGAVIMHNPIVDTYMEDEGEGREEEVEEPTFELQGKEAHIISNSGSDH